MNSRQLAQKWPYPRHNKFVKELRSASANWFASKQFSTHPKMNYCLSSWDDWDKNIILKEVAEYINECKTKCAGNKSPFPLHKYLHHGLSSQATAFNLLGPLITRNDYTPLIALLKDKGIMPFLVEFIPADYRNRIVSISIQEVVERLKSNGTHQDWIEEFQLKYGIA